MLHARHCITQKKRNNSRSFRISGSGIFTYSYSDIDAPKGHLVAMFWS